MTNRLEKLRFSRVGHSFLLCVVIVMLLGGCETKRNLRSDPVFGKFVESKVKTTRAQKLYYGSMAEGNQNNRPYRFVTWVDFGDADHYVIPKGTEMFIERIYRYGAINADHIVALGYLYKGGKKLEFECQLYGINERPPWELK